MLIDCFSDMLHPVINERQQGSYIASFNKICFSQSPLNPLPGKPYNIQVVPHFLMDLASGLSQYRDIMMGFSEKVDKIHLKRVLH
jgi:hypothetical protein